MMVTITGERVHCKLIQSAFTALAIMYIFVFIGYKPGGHYSERVAFADGAHVVHNGERLSITEREFSRWMGTSKARATRWFEARKKGGNRASDDIPEVETMAGELYKH